MTPPSDLRLHLRNILETNVSVTLPDLQQTAELLATLKSWVADALIDSHLVTVAAAVSEELCCDMESLQVLTIPVDILSLFPDWRSGSRTGFAPQSADWQFSPAGAGAPIQVVRLQLSPYSVTLSTALLLIKELFSVLDGEVQFQIAVEPGGDTEALMQVLATFHPDAADRITLLELKTCSLFAQDNARGVATPDGQPALLLPRGFRMQSERNRDALEQQVIDTHGSLPVYRSRLFWEGGNILRDDTVCLIGADTLYENMRSLGLTAQEVIRLFEVEFGPTATFLGSTSRYTGDRTVLRNFESVQASFHIDLDVSILGRINSLPQALLASADLTLPYCKDILHKSDLVRDHYLDDESAGRMIELEYKAFAERRSEFLEQYQTILKGCGYQISPVPDMRIDPGENIFSTRNLDFIYTNVLSGLKDNKPAIFYLPYGIPELDTLAARAYSDTGCQSIAITNSGRLANLLMLFRGGLRCACSVIQ